MRGWTTFVPIEKGDHRGSSEVNSRPPAAKNVASPLAKGDKEAFPGPANVEIPGSGWKA